jgi:hypothetical protein
MMTSGFKEKITSDLVIGIWDNKINEIKTSLKAPFEKYISDLVSGTFRGGLFDINGYLYDMLNKIFVPLISEYDSSWTYKGAAKIAVSSNNIGEIQSKTKNVFLEIIDRFLVWFKLTIFKVPLRAIKIAKDFKKCDVKSNPKPFVNIPDVENFDYEKARHLFLHSTDEEDREEIKTKIKVTSPDLPNLILMMRSTKLGEKYFEEIQKSYMFYMSNIKKHLPMNSRELFIERPVSPPKEDKTKSKKITDFFGKN